MDGKRFDDLSRRFATRQSRRGFLALIGVATTGALTRLETDAAPKKEKPKKEKPTKCYGEGSHCTNGKQCCSGTCTNRQCAADIPACTSPADCAGIDTECQQRTCINGICGVANTDYGTPVSNQLPGDCQQNVCDGFGGVTSIADDSDLPEVADECMYGTCSGGVPGTGYWEAGQPCSSNGGFECDGNGQCIVCQPGAITSCYSGPEGTLDVGVCRSGTMICLDDGSGFGECSGEVLPSPEQCNLLDDDCDGLVDEGVLEVGLLCDLGLPDWMPGNNCNEGTVQCHEGVIRCCSTSCTELGGGPLCA